jgi:hypothetical protein
MKSTRTCPICGSEFAPKAIYTVACSGTCARTVKRLREAIRQYNAGNREIRDETLEGIMRLLEADEAVNAARAEIEESKVAKHLADELEDEAENERWRERQKARLSFHRLGASIVREGYAKMLARGWRPLVPSPPLPPEQRSIKRLDLSGIVKRRDFHTP